MCIRSDLCCHTVPVLREVGPIHEFIFKKLFALLLSYDISLKLASNVKALSTKRVVTAVYNKTL